MTCRHCGATLKKSDANTYICPDCGTKYTTKAKFKDTVAVPQNANITDETANVPNMLVTNDAYSLTSRLLALRGLLGSICKDGEEKDRLDNIVKGNGNRIAQHKQNIKKAHSDYSKERKRILSDRQDLYDNNKLHLGISNEHIWAVGIVVALLGLIVASVLLYMDIIPIVIDGYAFSIFNVGTHFGERAVEIVICIVLYLLTGAAIGIAAGLVTIVVEYVINALCVVINEISSTRMNNAKKRYEINDLDNDSKDARQKRDFTIESENKGITDCQQAIADAKTALSTNKYTAVMHKKFLYAQTKFFDLIHPSDYENIDYLIYLFVTKRADTIKEALKELDTQKRNNELLASIDTSSKYVVKNMKSIAKQLGDKLQNSLGEIASEVSASRSTMINESNRVNDRIDYYLGYDPAAFELSSWDKFKGSLGL